MTAYSTAVGPSSRVKKSTVAFQNLLMGLSFLSKPVSTFLRLCPLGETRAGFARIAPCGSNQGKTSAAVGLAETVACASGSSARPRAAIDSTRRRTNLRANRGEGRFGVLAHGCNRREADHDDQGQHHRILHGCRAIFRLEKSDDSLITLSHTPLSFPAPWAQWFPFPRPRMVERGRVDGLGTRHPFGSLAT